MYGFSDHLKPIPLTGLSADLQGSSRYSIRMASAGSIEQTFVQLEDGIRRLTLPLPTGPKHVHCYLVDGTLFDTGLGLGDAHLGFLRDGVLIGGDHLLRAISPAVGLYPDSRPDPLGDYLASLERTIELAPRIVYPGHGEPLDDASARARQLIEHHRARLDDTAAALAARPRTAYEVSLELFGRELSPTQRRFAVAETLSHLERL